MKFETVSTETWQIRLPVDWIEQPRRSDGQIYFESKDGLKGLYLATWNVGQNPRSEREELDAFRRIELRTLHGMEGRSWEILHQWNSDGPPFGVCGLDALDESRSYRIVCKVLADLPLVVRASFHDYDCTRYETSRLFFAPIIESLVVHHAEE